MDRQIDNKTSVSNAQDRPEPMTNKNSILYLTDIPYKQNGHQFLYHTDKMNVIAITFVGAYGKSVRILFDPRTADFSVQTLDK